MQEFVHQNLSPLGNRSRSWVTSYVGSRKRRTLLHIGYRNAPAAHALLALLGKVPPSAKPLTSPRPAPRNPVCTRGAICGAGRGGVPGGGACAVCHVASTWLQRTHCTALNSALHALPPGPACTEKSGFGHGQAPGVGSGSVADHLPLQGLTYGIDFRLSTTQGATRLELIQLRTYPAHHDVQGLFLQPVWALSRHPHTCLNHQS